MVTGQIKSVHFMALPQWSHKKKVVSPPFKLTENINNGKGFFSA